MTAYRRSAMWRRSASLFFAMTAFVLFGNVTQPAEAAQNSSCALGAYRSRSGDILTLTKTPSGVFYNFLNGARGALQDPKSHVVCHSDSLIANNGATFEKLHFKTTNFYFMSHGVRLYGQLLEPQREGAKPPLLIFIHGSEKWSPIGMTSQQLITAQGVSTFVYDKRGTGRSGGTYTQDFYVLADDAVAAAKAVRNVASGRFDRLGFFGGSQGGWVGPRAALEAKADFVEAGFGVVGTPVEQDQWQVSYQLREHGFEPNADVHAITDATANVVRSNFTTGFDVLARLRNEYGKEPWYPYLDGQYTGELLRGDFNRAEWQSAHVPWQYDSLAVLRQLTIPQLWVFAAEDATAPSLPSIKRLEVLQRRGSHISIVVFPNTDHSITTFSTQGPGQRTVTGFANGYWRLLADFAKNSLTNKPYGDAKWIPPSMAARIP